MEGFGLGDVSEGVGNRGQFQRAVGQFLVFPDHNFVHLLVELHAKLLVIPQVFVAIGKQHDPILVTGQFVVGVFDHWVNVTIQHPQSVFAGSVCGDAKLNLRVVLVQSI